jgi:mannose-6-phosphate isomerase class I
MDKMYKKFGNYVVKPMTIVKGCTEKVFAGYDAIADEVRCRVGGGTTVVAVDSYPGIDARRLMEGFQRMSPVFSVLTDDSLLPFDRLDAVFGNSLSDDRVFGFMTNKRISDCFDKDKLEGARQRIACVSEGVVLVVGPGASLFCEPDILILADINRWEIQLRYRKGMPNWLADNPDDPILSKYKRGFFIEWRLADRHKDGLFSRMDYIIDMNDEDMPKMISGDAFSLAMGQASGKPLRMEPYFDSGVWGGQWMRGVFGLPDGPKNYAWSFDGVPEENSINLRFGQDYISLPMMDMVLTCPKRLLGEEVVARIGREFPIRFDLLDTMGGGNLSLQVHPLTEYIQQQFGMHYTQDESYYILDAKEDSCVYIGLKDNVDKDEMYKDLKEANEGKHAFDAEKYVNRIPVKKHDHILIPAGTIHCSGKDTMVLEISATPYIFTFKLWDWGRVGLDGLPRPIHLEHGFKNIQFDRNTKWVKENLVDRVSVLRNDKDVLVERTGLHRLEFIETRRYTSSSSFRIDMGDSMDVINLVEGESGRIESIDGSFEPFGFHYGETFIIPSSVRHYRVKADSGKISIIVASVRGNA